MDGAEAEGGFPLCGGCRVAGRCRLGIASMFAGEDGVVSAQLRCDATNQAGPMVAHGGWTAAVFDDVMGRVPLKDGVMAVTATLQVQFLKPVPVERDLVLRARIERREGRRLYLSGALFLAGATAELATATGVWVVRRADHFERHRQWLGEQIQEEVARPSSDEGEAQVQDGSDA